MTKNPDLNKAAATALKDYLGLSYDETLLVVSDEPTRDIGMTLFAEAKKICNEAFYLEMKPRETNGEEPPDQVASMMKKVDVVICPTAKSMTHTDALRRAKDLGVRVATMPGITEEIMIRCLSADYKKIIELTDVVAKKLEKASKIRVETKAGTDMTMFVRGRKVISSTGVLRNIGETGNLPSGEVYLAPVEGKSSGLIILDGSVAGIGLLNEPININIKNGYAREIYGGEEADRLKELLDQAGKDAYALGEFGIGTNYKAKLSGKILEDEKVKGTIHFAFGNNVSMGGKINVKIHIDGLVKKPTIYVDEEMIMQAGKFLI
jgi:leucyl aminopeptidase (aminopeptidase T)